MFVGSCGGTPGMAETGLRFRYRLLVNVRNTRSGVARANLRAVKAETYVEVENGAARLSLSLLRFGTISYLKRNSLRKALLRL